MTKPILIHQADSTVDEIHARHAAIEGILETMGRERVKIALVNGGFPTGWNPIVHAWLAGDKLEEKK